MDTDSLPGFLPLAEAMIAWSDPALISAIEKAEAAVPANHLHRYGRPTLGTLSSQRRLPRRFRPYANWAPILAVDDAWDHVFGAMRLMIERAEVTLDGVPSFQFGEPRREGLPSDRAAEFVFDPSAGAVFVGGQVFLHVRAARRDMVPRSTKRSADGRVSADTNVLPLRAALVAWCDHDAVSACKRLEWLYQRDVSILTPTPYLRCSEDPEPDLESFELYEIQVPRLALTLAWSGLEQDFRGRIERGELRPEGVRTFPLARTEREPVPHLWAADLQFDFGAARLHVVRNGVTTHSYIAVQIVRDVPRGEPDASFAEPGSELPAESEQRGGREDSDRRPRPGGRRSEWPAVLEALRIHWDELYPNGLPDEPGPWTELARRLHRRMVTARLQAGVRVPAEETVRKHLPEIYAQVLGEKGGSGPNDQ